MGDLVLQGRVVQPSRFSAAVANLFDIPFDAKDWLPFRTNFDSPKCAAEREHLLAAHHGPEWRQGARMLDHQFSQALLIALGEC
ncbi:hypothetical protein D3C71_1924900 [compost metagenome]